MPKLLWDASALIKRYIAEAGSGTANALFAATPAMPAVVTFLGYAETAAILRPKFNQGAVNLVEFNRSRSLLEREVITDDGFTLLSIDDIHFLQSIQFVDRHNLNSADAAILSAYLTHSRLRNTDGPSVLVASDRRLLRAAAAEGLATLNPEAVPAADVSAHLAAL